MPLLYCATSRVKCALFPFPRFCPLSCTCIVSTFISPLSHHNLSACAKCTPSVVYLTEFDARTSKRAPTSRAALSLSLSGIGSVPGQPAVGYGRKLLSCFCAARCPLLAGKTTALYHGAKTCPKGKCTISVTRPGYGEREPSILSFFFRSSKEP